MRTAVFLDRDDTLMEANTLPPPPPPAKAGDVVDPAQVRLLPGAAEACRLLREAGFTLIIFSNQGVVARGGATTATVDAVNSRLLHLLHQAAGWDSSDAGPLIDRFYYCPWHPRGTVEPYNCEHPWRKPGPGMILAAATDMHLDLGSSWVIGDAPRDIAAGIAAGIPASHCLQIGPGTPYPTILTAAHAITTRSK